MTVKKHDAKVLQPGMLAWFTLDEFTDRIQPGDENKWGLCECDGTVWIGERTNIDGREALRIPFSTILEKKEVLHPGRADGEIYFFVGYSDDGKFVWYLLNKEQAEKHINPTKGGTETGAAAVIAPNGVHDPDEVIHQVSLADLICLADLWDVQDENIACAINELGELVPTVIDDDEEVLKSLAQIEAVIEEQIPGSDELNLVLEYRAADGGREVNITTMDYVCSPEGMARKTKWHTFTDTYKEVMDS